MGCKLMELKSPILLYTKMYLIFWRPFKFGGPVRSHSPYRPKDAPVSDHQRPVAPATPSSQSSTAVRPSYHSLPFLSLEATGTLTIPLPEL